MRENTVPSDHFEALYAANPDPWRLASSDYERAKHAATLAALPRPRYVRGFEIGCAIGVLSEALAGRCDELLSVDPVEAALAQARTRMGACPGVRLARMSVPGQWPDGRFDLVVISEVIDYLGRADILRLADRVRDALSPGGDVILVHWIGKKTRTPTGDEATDAFIAAAGRDFAVLARDRNRDYRLDLLRRN